MGFYSKCSMFFPLRLPLISHTKVSTIVILLSALISSLAMSITPAHANTAPLCDVAACLIDERTIFCQNDASNLGCAEFPNCCSPEIAAVCPGLCKEPTATPTSTQTETPEATATETPQPTATYTYTASATATTTFTATATHTATATFTNSPEPTSTNTPQPSSTSTPPPTAIATRTVVATATHSPEPTSTNTPQPSSTSTPQPTAIAIRTVVATATHSPEPTRPSTPQPSATSSATPMATQTAIATATHTAQPSSTSTPNPTPTSIASAAPTSPPQQTPTALATATSSAALIALDAECVDTHKDGTFTSYFSYNNTSGVELSVQTDAVSGTINRIDAKEDSILPPTLFKPGIARGAVVVQHRSDSITWTVKVSGSEASSATVDSQTPRCRPVEPLASCEKNGVVVVGYNNPNSFSINIPYGADNSFSPGLDRSKSITSFSAGRLDAARTLELNAAIKPNSWTLRDQTVDLDAVVAGCQPNEVACMNVYSGEVIGNLDQVALELSSIAQRTAQTLQQARRKSVQSGRGSTRVKKLSVNRIEVELKRAITRAKQLEEEAYRLTIQLPKVTKSCIDAPAYCETIDRFDTFIALRRLYAHLLNMTKRQTNRFYFTEVGKTKRNRAPVVRAKRLVRFGHGELDKLPRLATDCT